MISHRGEVKVADLGIMKQLSPPKPGKAGSYLPKTNTFVGTSTYMSPERIDGKEYSYPADVWAFGLSLMTVALGRLPIETQGGYWTILHSIRDAPIPRLPETFSVECREFVDNCLKRNPEERMTCKQLLRHPFLNKARPEDLTYAQSYNRGKSELKSIIIAIHTHIKQMKADYKEKVDYKFEDNSKLHVKIFGDVTNSDSLDILHRILFGEDRNLSLSVSQKELIQGSAKVSDASNDRATTKGKRFSRPRLINLAKQLYLPVDKVLSESRQYFEEIASLEKAFDQ